MCISVSGGVRSDSSWELSHVRQSVVTVARAHGVAAIDMVHTDFTGEGERGREREREGGREGGREGERER